VRAVLAFGIFLLSATAAQCGLTRADLSSVSAAPSRGARLDLGITARDTAGKMRSIGEILDGRAGFVVFADYTCNTLCGTDLVLLSAAIERAHLRSSDYRIVAFGLDPKDSSRSAVAMENANIPSNLRPAAVFLLPDRAAVARAAKALGFHFVYDSAIDQFAHPAAIYALAPDGAVRAVLSPLTLTPQNLRAVLYAPQSAGLFQRIRHLCYAYDPATGIYTARMDIILKIAAAATVLLLGTAVLLLVRLRRRAA
jgi:protein SCO1/2